MEFFFATRQNRRRVYLIALILLAFLIALLWQRFQIHQPLNLRTTQQIKVSQVEEPIQPIPLSLALNQNKVALGKQLFQDVHLSKDNRVSCLSCHSLSTGGVDRANHLVDLNGGTGNVNTPTVFNSGFNFRLNWDGNFENLAAQTDVLVQSHYLMEGKLLCI